MSCIRPGRVATGLSVMLWAQCLRPCGRPSGALGFHNDPAAVKETLASPVLWVNALPAGELNPCFPRHRPAAVILTPERETLGFVVCTTQSARAPSTDASYAAKQLDSSAGDLRGAQQIPHLALQMSSVYFPPAAGRQKISLKLKMP